MVKSRAREFVATRRLSKERGEGSAKELKGGVSVSGVKKRMIKEGSSCFYL